MGTDSVTTMPSSIRPWFGLGLGVAAVVFGVFWTAWLSRVPRQPPRSKGPRIVWMYEPTFRGAVISTPCVADDRLYISVIRDHGLQPGGVVVALQAIDGKPIWSFDDGGDMLHMYSSPRFADGMVFIGEGMHANFQCKLYGIDAGQGTKLWHFPVRGHVESTPLILGQSAIFGAGDDGVYAVHVRTGERIWHYSDQRHVDSTPAADSERVYVGSGGSRRFPTTEVIALKRASGDLAWRVPVDLPPWGSPIINGEQLYFGLGNGSLGQPASQPAGGMMCLDARTGRRIWHTPLPDAVFGSCAVAPSAVYVGCRDGELYSLLRTDGRILWTSRFSGPIVNSPMLADGKLYVAASDGDVACIDPVSGSRIWSFSVSQQAKAPVRLYSSPAILRSPEGATCIIVGTEVRFPGGSSAVVYCLEE